MRQSSHRTREGGIPDDPELMRRLREGDETVLREILKRHLPALRLYAERVLGGSGDPQEAVQEAFIRLWTHRESWRGNSSVRSLLYTITRNAALDELRRHRREVPLSEGPLVQPSGSRPDPLDALVENELLQAAERAISRLPRRRQEIFRLVREDGLTYREVAEVLDISPQTVANLMSLALQSLRVSLGPLLKAEWVTPRPRIGAGRFRQASGSD